MENHQRFAVYLSQDCIVLRPEGIATASDGQHVTSRADYSLALLAAHSLAARKSLPLIKDFIGRQLPVTQLVNDPTVVPSR